MNLRHKTSWLLGIMVVLATAGSGFYMYYRFEAALQQSVFNNVDAVARNTAVTIGDYLDSAYQDAQAISKTLPIERLQAGDLDAVEQHLEKMGGIFRTFRNGLFILSPEGDLLVDWPPHPEKRGQNFAYRPYFKRTLASQRGVLAAPYRSARTGQPVLTITSYLEDEQGHLIGILGCSAQLLDEQGLGALRSRKIGETGYIYVFDASRKMILHPKEERILAKDVPVGANVIFDRAIQGFEGVDRTVNSKGVPMLLAVHRTPGSSWIVGAQQPEKEAFSKIEFLQFELSLTSFGFSLFAALVGWWAVGRVLRPLNQLEAVVEDLELPSEEDDPEKLSQRQDLKQLEPITLNPELGTLARIIKKLYLGLAESLMESRQANRDMQLAQEDLTQALDASWQLTEQLESNQNVLAQQAHELEETNKQLKQTQSQMLQQEKLASVGQLAAGVAHEINNPMGFITSNLNTLSKYLGKIRGCDEELQQLLENSISKEQFAEIDQLRRKAKLDLVFEDIPELLEESLDGANRVREIVQNLKTFSRIDEAETKNANLNDCLDTTLKIAWNEIKYKATVEKDYGELPELKCYPQQLNQVFMNILVNAAHAIEESGVIKIRTWEETDVVFVAITDSGCGMSSETLQHIFEPFYTTKDVGKGTGLGMSIAWDIVQKHGGEIIVDSAVGTGTTFTLRFPLTNSLAALESEEPSADQLREELQTEAV